MIEGKNIKMVFHDYYAQMFDVDVYYSLLIGNVKH